MAKWGFVGHYSNTALLPPAEKCAGNLATVGTPAVDLNIYFSDGSVWAIVGAGAVETVNEIIDGLDTNSLLPQDAIIQAAFDEGVAENATVRRIATGGLYVIQDGLDKHPMLSFQNSGRGNIILQAGDAMDETRPDGAEQSLIRVVARTHDSGGVLSYTGEISGLNLRGNKGNQLFPVHGIRLPNPNPSENTIDPDPGFTTNKDYASDRFRNLEVTGFSGIGIDVEAGRGRSHFQDIRCLSNDSHGLQIKANDCVVGDRCGFGGNGGYGLLIGSGSGGLVHDVNMWGSTSERHIGSLPFKFANTTGYTIRGCMINDTGLFDGRDERRAGVAVANLFHPDSDVFDSDGHAYDDVVADGDARIQNALTIRGYINSTTAHNNFFRSKHSVPFATPSNVGGALDGSKGTAYEYAIGVFDDAEVSITEAFTSRPDYRQWSNPDPVAIRCDDGGKATYYIHDTYTGTHRLGARGAGLDTHVLLGINESTDVDLDYMLQVGEQSSRHQILGYTEFGAAPLLRSSAVDSRATVDGDTRTISDKLAFQRLSTSGTIAAYTVTLPYIEHGSKWLYVLFIGGDITALTFKTTRSDGTLDVVPGASDRFDDLTDQDLPAAIKGKTGILFHWREDTHEWICVDVVRKADPFVVKTFSPSIALDADTGSSFQLTMTGNTTLADPVNMSDGQTIICAVIQDGTGGRTFTAYGANIRTAGGAAAHVLTAAANAVDLLTITRRGTLFMVTYDHDFKV